MAQPAAQRVCPGDLLVGDRPRSGIVRQHPKQTTDEASAVVDRRSPQRPRLPPAAIGKAVAQAHEHAKGTAEQRKRKLASR